MSKNANWIGGCATKLKAERVLRDMTQDEFAEELGVSDSTYKKTERKVLPPSIELLLCLKQYTGKTVDYFLSSERGDLENAWSSVNDCSELDKVIILMRLVSDLGKERCSEIIKNCREDNSDEECLDSRG